MNIPHAPQTGNPPARHQVVERQTLGRAIDPLTADGLAKVARRTLTNILFRAYALTGTDDREQNVRMALALAHESATSPISPDDLRWLEVNFYHLDDRANHGSAPDRWFQDAEGHFFHKELRYGAKGNGDGNKGLDVFAIYLPTADYPKGRVMPLLEVPMAVAQSLAA